VREALKKAQLRLRRASQKCSQKHGGSTRVKANVAAPGIMDTSIEGKKEKKKRKRDCVCLCLKFTCNKIKIIMEIFRASALSALFSFFLLFYKMLDKGSRL